ncbi:hypothetical protein B296_00026433 [Ensete ventricosum]|uniref:Uncharacterized protein n=1 Tax=Ensete ventricosum TaxID=4639 RepID=A0A426Z7Z5_ENSVE|nr:hypothetical protein B296_00026433 [Ensete ventricosum]
MRGVLSHHTSHPRWDFHPSDIGRGGFALDLACIELKKVLCLNNKSRTQSTLRQFERQSEMFKRQVLFDE